MARSCSWFHYHFLLLSIDTKSSQSAPEPHLKDLVHLPLAPYWYELGLMLELSPSDLKTIEVDQRGSIMRCAIEMFSIWLNISPSPTFEQLTRALLKIGQKEVAEQIIKKYGKQCIQVT